MLGPHRVQYEREREKFPFSFSTPSSLPVDRVREELGHDLGRALERDGVARGGRLEGHGEADERAKKEVSFGDLSLPRKGREEEE